MLLRLRLVLYALSADSALHGIVREIPVLARGIVVGPRPNSDRPLSDLQVLVPQAESLADPHTAIQLKSEEQAMPQMVAGVQDRLRLLSGQDLRPRPGRLQPRVSTLPGLALRAHLHPDVRTDRIPGDRRFVDAAAYGAPPVAAPVDAFLEVLKDTFLNPSSGPEADAESRLRRRAHDWKLPRAARSGIPVA
jgi:hypothetical protein